MTAIVDLDAGTAAALYAATPEGDPKRFLDYLIDHPGVQLWSEAMQEELGFAEHKQIALAAWTIGQEATRLGIARPWNEAQRGYSMSESAAALLAAARS
ncbi:MAG: hypothetical protein KF883_09550 [Thermomicrobiales bacterium]|nr:hypothetical protein [Thermomicrobiales bacterium]